MESNRVRARGVIFLSELVVGVCREEFNSRIIVVCVRDIVDGIASWSGMRIGVELGLGISTGMELR